MQESDIVERLREAARDEAESAVEQDFWHEETLTEAADEIERLRALTNDALVERLVEAQSAWLSVQQAHSVGDPHGYKHYAKRLTTALSSPSGEPAAGEARSVAGDPRNPWRGPLKPTPTAPVVPDREGESTIPAGMKPWHGGDSAPDDWDGGPVLWRAGSLECYGLRRDSLFWRSNAIIAYTPADTAEEGIDDKGNRYRFTPTDTADRREAIARIIRANWDESAVETAERAADAMSASDGWCR